MGASQAAPSQKFFTSNTAALPPSAPARAWWTWLLALGVAALIWWSFRGVGVDLGMLLGSESRRQMLSYLLDLYPPDLTSATVRSALWGSIETLAISLMGTLLAVLIALLMVGGASRALTTSGVLFTMPGAGRGRRLTLLGLSLLARGILNILRAIPELIWALIFILAVGLGPFAGVLALGVHTGGVLGKLYAETVESLDPQPLEALQATGAGKVAIFLYGMLPQAAPHFLAYGLYRWEVNIRAAAILGFVGAGGLGKQMYVSLSLFHHHQLLTQLLALFVLVTFVDAVSTWLRRRLS
ncbi:MAG: phosphonate ABC transporter, permease protein PhnE [Candidatus Tectomicrobia bacterium]|nr:phosphonate ABC transporter, permease protein PhnE [Candidatus Tectomicrobia bacterium]